MDESTQIFKKETFRNNEVIERITEDVIHKAFIMDFLSQIPLESLKKIVSFEETKAQDVKIGKSDKETQLALYLNEFNLTKLECKIILTL